MAEQYDFTEGPLAKQLIFYSAPIQHHRFPTKMEASESFWGVNRRMRMLFHVELRVNSVYCDYQKNAEEGDLA